jgi:hypothetical protein
MTAVDCASSSLACGDMSVTTHTECPPVGVTINEADVDCAKCVEKRTYFKDGTLRSVRELCTKCNVTGSFQLN